MTVPLPLPLPLPLDGDGDGDGQVHSNGWARAGSPFGTRSFYGVREQNSADSRARSRPGSANASVFTR
ncbi:hypothetical protein SAMN05216260_107252 [Streptomyces griseoaurantiacus]|uniref:Uncharacterized protein n=1 Tax=Streptomyces griseoaurantiacus TaxID=68213 RepID=A0A1G7KCG3_9ACTN|nr:hypothetical protein SAMN05216260_107252 [Streptomyces jietaisiensis]